MRARILFALSAIDFSFLCSFAYISLRIPWDEPIFPQIIFIFTVRSRASVKKSSNVLKLSRKLLGASQDVQIVDDSAPTQIEEVFTQSAIACAPSLPSTDMGKGMLNRHPLTQFVTTFWRLLSLA